MKITDRLQHDQPRGWRHRLARWVGLDHHDRAPLPVRRDPDESRDPFDRDGRRRRNRVRERARAVGRSRGQVMRR